MQPSQEYLKREFIHHISDTIALLGGGEGIVQKIRQVEEKPLTPQVIEEIRNFNNDRVEETKTRLVLCNTTSVNRIE
jgi:hypothetical protein